MQADVWSTSPLPLTPPVSVAAVPMSFSALSSRCLICVDPFSIGSPVPSQAQTGRTTNVVMTLDSANTTPNMSSLVPLDWHGHGSFNVRVNVLFPVLFHREERNVDLVLRRLPSRRQRSLGLNRLLHRRPGSQTKARKRIFSIQKDIC